MREGTTLKMAEASERPSGGQSTLRRPIGDSLIPPRPACEGGMSGHRRRATAGLYASINDDVGRRNSPKESIRTSMRHQGRNIERAPLGARPE